MQVMFVVLKLQAVSTKNIADVGSLTLHITAILGVISVIAAATGIAHVTWYVYWTKECTILLVVLVCSACHVVTLSSCNYSNNIGCARVAVLFRLSDSVASEAGFVTEFQISKHRHSTECNGHRGTCEISSQHGIVRQGCPILSRC